MYLGLTCAVPPSADTGLGVTQMKHYIVDTDCGFKSETFLQQTQVWDFDTVYSVHLD